jgi:hypothetical protein
MRTSFFTLKWRERRFYLKIVAAYNKNINIPSSLKVLPPSISLIHHPEAQGIVSTPRSSLGSSPTAVGFAVPLAGKGSLQLPSSPLDLQE